MTLDNFEFPDNSLESSVQDNSLSVEEENAAKVISERRGKSLPDLLNPSSRIILAIEILKYIPVTFGLINDRPEIEKVILSRLINRSGLNFEEIYSFNGELEYRKKSFYIEPERMRKFVKSEEYKKIIKRYILP